MNELNKDVYITIKSTQALEGEPVPGSELITIGEYSCENSRVTFAYEEDENIGLGSTVTIFTVTPDEVVLERKGDVRSRMVFRLHERTDFRYEMPMGLFNMQLDTQEIECKLGEHGGSLRLVYDLAMDERRTMISRNSFDIDITDKTPSSRREIAQ